MLRGVANLKKKEEFEEGWGIKYSTTLLLEQNEPLIFSLYLSSGPSWPVLW